MSFGIIYKATCLPTGLAYIGQTINSLDCRKRAHFQDARRGSSTPFHLAIQTHGEDSFHFEVLLDCVPIRELDKQEKKLIAAHDTYHNGYNAYPGNRIRWDRRFVHKSIVNDLDKLSDELRRTPVFLYYDDDPWFINLNKDDIFDMFKECLKHGSLTNGELLWISSCVYYAPKDIDSAEFWIYACAELLFPEQPSAKYGLISVLIEMVCRFHEELGICYEELTRSYYGEDYEYYYE